MVRLMRRTALIAAGLLALGAGPAAATCTEVQRLFAQGYSEEQIAAGFNAPIAAVQSCTRQRPAVIAPAGPAPYGAAGPPPYGAAGRAPLGAAGPAPLGAAGPAPIGSSQKVLKQPAKR